MANRKILFIAQHRLNRSPSQRFRFEQYLSLFEAHGYECELSFLIDEEDDKVLDYSRDRQKALQMLEKLREKTGEPALEMPKEDITEQEPEEAMREPMPEATQGLMARR